MEAEPKKEDSKLEPKDLFLLAGQYKQAAALLRQQGKPRKPMSWAPFRLCAIHAIELYLSAFLLHEGYKQDDVYGLGHDLAKREERARKKGLELRVKTKNHLAQMRDNREYLSSRYTPQMTTKSEINRMEATLEQVAKHVTAKLRPVTSKQ